MKDIVKHLPKGQKDKRKKKMKKRKTLLKHKVCQPNRLKFFSNKKRYELYKVSDAMCKSIEENLCIH